MKKQLCFPAILLIACLSANAQGVAVHKDGIYNNNALYAKMDKTGIGNSVIYSVKLPKGSEILNARYDEWLHNYVITFTESGQQITMKSDPNFDQKLANAVIESNMVVGGQYNVRSEAHFMSKYGYGSMPAVDKQDDAKPLVSVDYKIVERNHKMPFVGSDSYVKQDGKIIGTYKVESTTIAGKAAKSFTFYLPNGAKVAEVIVLQEKNGECKVSTMKDNQQCTIGLKNNDNITTAREVASFLTDKGYL